MERPLLVMGQGGIHKDAALVPQLLFQVSDRGAKSHALGQGRRPPRLAQQLETRALRGRATPLANSRARWGSAVVQ